MNEFFVLKGSSDKYRKEIRQRLALVLRGKTTETHIRKKALMQYSKNFDLKMVVGSFSTGLINKVRSMYVYSIFLIVKNRISPKICSRPLSKLEVTIFDNEIFAVQESTDDAYSKNICYKLSTKYIRNFDLKMATDSFKRGLLKIDHNLQLAHSLFFNAFFS